MNKTPLNNTSSSKHNSLLKSTSISDNKKSTNFFKTSTPINNNKNMEFIFSDNGKVKCSFNTDSGYLSTNFDYTSNETVNNSGVVSDDTTLFSNKSFFLSEDALLEKPFVDNICNNSIVNSSTASISTNFSGFDDTLSDTSLVIPYVPPILLKSNDLINNKNNDNDDDAKFISPDKLKVLNNVTNTLCDNRTKVMLKKSYYNDKENRSPSVTPKKNYTSLNSSDFSPDLFSDDETSNNKKLNIAITPLKEQYINQNDIKLIRNVKNGLSGVYPPPSVTIIQLTVVEMLEKMKNNEKYFWKGVQTTSNNNSLLITGNYNDTTNKNWPDILNNRYHGLHYNRSKCSEEFELLCNKYAERYVGAETQSSCTLFQEYYDSPKRKLIKTNWPNKSPSRRLSHLARRRITFSSANLHTINNSILGSRARQILVDTRKFSKKKSPRKTPIKSPFKGGNGSEKKKKYGNENIAPDPGTSRRALFQSPNCSTSKSFTYGSLSLNESEKKSTKRALFTSPPLKMPSISPLKKRKRPDSISDTLKPSKLLKLIENRPSDEFKLLTKYEELSDIHKKKLQWAVYESLRIQNITPNHPQFKVFASILARVTRRFLPSLAAKAPRPEEGTSERMLRIARRHSHAVVKGKTVDEIINEYIKIKKEQKLYKPQGYISLDEFRAFENGNNNKNTSNNNNNNPFQDRVNIIDNNTNNNKSIEKRKIELSEDNNNKLKFNESRIDRIKKVIKFEDNNGR